MMGNLLLNAPDLECSFGITVDQRFSIDSEILLKVSSKVSKG